MSRRLTFAETNTASSFKGPLAFFWTNPVQSVLNNAGVFDNRGIHAKWIASYRNNKLQNEFNEVITKRLLAIMQLPPGSRVLDAGCGTGEHAFRLASYDLDIVGVDISETVLEKARSAASERNLPSVDFRQSSITDLSVFPNNCFDAVHCRGVLMHIPPWEDALRELCRVLKPGGRIAILENNHRSVETRLVRLVRKFRNSDSALVATDAGVEFRPLKSSREPLTRVANISHLVERLKTHNVTLISRCATEFWDIARWPSGPVRNFIIRFNHAWFSCHLSSRLSLGNLLVGIKNP